MSDETKFDNLLVLEEKGTNNATLGISRKGALT